MEDYLYLFATFNYCTKKKHYPYDNLLSSLYLYESFTLFNLIFSFSYAKEIYDYLAFIGYNVLLLFVTLSNWGWMWFDT